MTRTFRAIQLPCTRVVLLSGFAALCLGFTAPAFADDALGNDVAAFDDSQSAPDVLSDVSANVTAAVAPAAQQADPKIENPLHHFYCVEYARLRSGFQIFGDARTWWTKARNLYDEIATPVADAVMVFSGSSRIRKGHVAVVTAVLSPREIRVDQANWQNHGEIDKNTPVLDVSADNDWSQVRVWDVRSGQFGGHVYKISGFIARPVPVASGS